MEEHEVEQGTTQLIRRFSHDVAKNERDSSLAISLKQATISEEKRLNQPWRRWYEDEDEISTYVNAGSSRADHGMKRLMIC